METARDGPPGGFLPYRSAAVFIWSACPFVWIGDEEWYPVEAVLYGRGWLKPLYPDVRRADLPRIFGKILSVRYWSSPFAKQYVRRAEYEQALENIQSNSDFSLFNSDQNVS